MSHTRFPNVQYLAGGIKIKNKIQTYWQISHSAKLASCLHNTDFSRNSTTLNEKNWFLIWTVCFIIGSDREISEAFDKEQGTRGAERERIDGSPKRHLDRLSVLQRSLHHRNLLPSTQRQKRLHLLAVSQQTRTWVHVLRGRSARVHILDPVRISHYDPNDCYVGPSLGNFPPHNVYDNYIWKGFNGRPNCGRNGGTSSKAWQPGCKWLEKYEF